MVEFTENNTAIVNGTTIHLEAIKDWDFATFHNHFSKAGIVFEYQSVYDTIMTELRNRAGSN